MAEALICRRRTKELQGLLTVTANDVSALCGRVMLEGQVKKACHLDPEPTSQWVKMCIPPPAGECLVAVRK